MICPSCGAPLLDKALKKQHANCTRTYTERLISVAYHRRIFHAQPNFKMGATIVIYSPRVLSPLPLKLRTRTESTP